MAILIFTITSEMSPFDVLKMLLIGITHFRLNGLIFEMLLVNIAFPRISALGAYLAIDVGLALVLEGRT